MLDTLPVELIENICNFLELDSLNELKNVSKIFKSTLSNQIYWKIRCNLDYCFNPATVGTSPTPVPQASQALIKSDSTQGLDWEAKYISLYNSICKFCYKKT